jgi:hypothetical protein
VSAGGHLAYWEGLHDGYQRLADPVTYRRGVARLGPEHWLVLDELVGAVSHSFRLHWLLPDLPLGDGLQPGSGTGGATTPPLGLETPDGRYVVATGILSGALDWSLVRADAATPRGWWSPYYHDREPALSLAIASQGTSVRFWTLLGPAGATLTSTADGLQIGGAGWSAEVRLGNGSGPLVTAICYRNPAPDELAIATGKGE